MEIWKDVPEYEGVYMISNKGRLKALEREIAHGNTKQIRRETIKHQWMNDDGYMICKLSKDGRNKNVAVHRLVALAFLDNPENKAEVNHIDGNRSNNDVANLEWVTRAENIQDTITRGTHVSLRDLHGENNPNFGNHKLHLKYIENDELRMTQARPGAQNGRAKPVEVTLRDGRVLCFDYIGECAKWLIDNHVYSITHASLCERITSCAKTGQCYKGSEFRFI